MASKNALGHIADATAIAVWGGVVARRLVGQRSMFAVVELEPNTAVPEHRHPHEQLGLVLTGGGRFRVGHEVMDVSPGSTWNIPPDIPHEFTVGPEGAVVIDVFTPNREDWEGLPQAQDRPPRWP
ncbi:MAG TPA: cupin domain-containing protein [Candidatus Limnocylindrales bacterium]|nr:cupin domain-containing protein [Candidatus Limnocylindrales bacterium]